MTARRPLWLKLAAVIMVVTLVPLAVVGWLVYDVNERALEDRIREFQLAIAGDIGRAVGAELDAARTALRAVRRVLVEGDRPDDERLDLATALVGADPTLDHAAIHGPDGRLIDALVEDGLAFEPPETLAAELLDGAGVGPAISDAARVPLAVAIEVGGQRTGYVATAVSLAPITARAGQLARAYFAGQADPITVVDLNRRRLVGAGGAPGEVLRSPALEALTPESHAVGAAPSRVYAGIGGRRIVAALVPIAGTPWSVLVKQDAEVIFASLDTTRRAVWTTVGLAILAAWLAALVFARTLTAPLRRLVAFAGRLAMRDYAAKAEVRTADELAVLGQAMNDAAAALEAGEVRLAEEVAIRADLGRYLPAELVDKVVTRDQDMALGGRRMQVTVMFADVVGFTPLSERLSPETVVQILNEMFSLATEIVFRNDGIVDKFIGDCLMALWGVPDPTDDHAERAVAAAEELVRWIEVGADGWREKYGVELAIAVGIHTGEAVVGNIGSDRRMEYTAIGDTVNVAARLESIARPMQVLVSRTTMEAAGDLFDYGFVETRTVPGRREPIDLFAVEI